MDIRLDADFPPSCLPALSGSLVVLTGAGISAESGLSPFRGPQDGSGDGAALWEKFDFHEVATPQAFARDPDHAHEFYNLRRATAVGAKPNAAHFALCDLEHAIAAAGGHMILISQNVDDLHTQAGSKALIPMHGSLFHVRCLGCSAVWEHRDALGTQTPCPTCGKAGQVRPDIVWFGEMPRGLEEIDAAIRQADLFVAIGTSGTVYPAAGLVAEANQSGIPSLELSLDPSANSALFSYGAYGPATERVPQWVAQTLARNAV